MVKKGDTLIEVTLAVGIFSMIAIAVVSVMSGGTSGAQTALETTLAREEIDTQAEALRFIQSSYIANKDGSDKRYTALWDKITSNAIILNNTTSDEEILEFTPESCVELYEPSNNSVVFRQKGFVINPKALSTFTENTVDSVYISATNQNSKFSQASTYPHLIFGTQHGTNDTAELSAEDRYNSVYRAEGLYIVAVRDKETTKIVGETGAQKTSAFYDFFIRTCWYGSNANSPSTISTVIRLYDPKAIDSQDND